MDWTQWLTGALLVVSAGKVQEPAIAGYWTFDAQLSDRATSIRRMAGEETYDPRRPSHDATPSPAPPIVKALLQEALAVNPHMTIAPMEPGTILIVDGTGISRLFHTTGEPERQDFEAGPVDIRTFWAHGELRQEFELGGATRLFRRYRSDAARERLIEMIAVESDLVPAMRPLIRVYATDRVP